MAVNCALKWVGCYKRSREKWVTYEPFPIALKSFAIKFLNGDFSGLVTRPHAMVYDAFIYNSEASFSQDEIGPKVLRREPKLLVGKNIHIAVSSTFAEIFDIHGSQWSARFMTYSSNFSYDDWLTLIDEGKENGSFGFGSNRKLKLPAGLGFALESEMERWFWSSMLKQIPMNLDLNRNRVHIRIRIQLHYVAVDLRWFVGKWNQLPRNWNCKLNLKKERER